MCDRHQPLNGADSGETADEYLVRKRDVPPQPTKRPVWLERLQAKDMTASVLSAPYRGSER